MHLIEAIYVLGVIVSISACVPQLRQLVRAKASDEFSVSTWATWTATQCATLLYVVHLGDTLMMVANILWVSFYAMMLGLILRYRRKKPLAVEPIALEA